MVWEELRILVVGDSRVEALMDGNFPLRPTQVVTESIPGATTPMILERADEILTNNFNQGNQLFDVLIIVGFHCDFTQLIDFLRIGRNIMVPNLHCDLQALMNEIKKYLQKWYQEYPYCTVLITMPFIPQFFTYNVTRLLNSINLQEIQGIYSPRYSAQFRNEMLNIINTFFALWNKQLTPKPVALARMNKSANRGIRQKNVVPMTEYNGPLRDGLHFKGKTVGYFWKILKSHFEFIQKVYRGQYTDMQEFRLQATSRRLQTLQINDSEENSVEIQMETTTSSENVPEIMEEEEGAVGFDMPPVIATVSPLQVVNVDLDEESNWDNHSVSDHHVQENISFAINNQSVQAPAPETGAIPRTTNRFWQTRQTNQLSRTHYDDRRDVQRQPVQPRGRSQSGRLENRNPAERSRSQSQRRNRNRSQARNNQPQQRNHIRGVGNQNRGGQLHRGNQQYPSSTYNENSRPENFRRNRTTSQARQEVNYRTTNSSFNSTFRHENRRTPYVRGMNHPNPDENNFPRERFARNSRRPSNHYSNQPRRSGVPVMNRRIEMTNRGREHQRPHGGIGERRRGSPERQRRETVEEYWRVTHRYY